MERETPIQELIENKVTNGLGYEPLRKDKFLDGEIGLKLHLCEIDSKIDNSSYSLVWKSNIRPYTYEESIFGRLGFEFY